MVKIIFEYTTSYGVYRDALHLPDDHAFTEEEINAMKQERLNNWIAAIEAPPSPPPELIEIGGIPYERVELDGQIILKPVQV